MFVDYMKCNFPMNPNVCLFVADLQELLEALLLVPMYCFNSIQK